MIRKWSDKRKGKSEEFKQMQEQDRLETMLVERKKSANQRELEKFYKDKEEAEIKKQLDIIHAQQSKDTWSSNSILKKDKSILADDRPILKEKNIFEGQKNMFMGHGSMFKW